MPRIRTLKPEILEDEKTSRLSDTAFRLFSSMIILADDHGNVRADARWLQAQIWWAHSSPPNVLLTLVELWRAGLIDVYGVRGGTYATLLGWAKHQRIDNAGKGRVPGPHDPDAVDVSINGETIPRKRNQQDTPQLAEDFREIPLDQEGDQEGDQERDQEGDVAASRDSSPASEPAGRRRDQAPRRAAGSQQSAALPDAWVPREAELRLATKLGCDVNAEAERFRDYYAARGTTLVDWHAAFRGWLRKVSKFDQQQGKRTAQGDAPEQPREIAEL